MNGEALSFAVTDEPSLEDVAFIEDRLIEYNVAQARPYRPAPAARVPARR